MTEKRSGSFFKAAQNIVLIFFIDFIVNFAWSVLVSAGFAAVFTLRQGGTGEGGIFEYLSGSPEFLFAVSFYNIFIIWIVRLFWKRAGKNSSNMMGLQWRENSARLFGLGILGGTLEMALIMLVSFAMGTLWYKSSGFGIYSAREMFNSILFGTLAFLLVGFGEEAIFRGYIQKRLMLSVGNGWALLLSSLVFMAAHLATYGKLLDFIDVFLGGLVLGYIYILTNSLYLPAGYHFIYDLIQVNIAKLQEYEHYKGAVMYMFGNSGDLIISNINYGNIVEVSFIIVELTVLTLLFIFRKKLRTWNVV